MNTNIDSNILEPLKIITLNKNGEPSNVHIFNTSKTSAQFNDTDLFHEDEKIYLEKYNTPISISKQKILQDDTIRSIKIKMLKEYDFQEFSYEEIYMFSEIHSEINFQKYFQYLVKDNYGISRKKLGQLLINLQLAEKKENITDLADMDTDEYSYKDIENELQINNNAFHIYTPIGHKI